MKKKMNEIKKQGFTEDEYEFQNSSFLAKIRRKILYIFLKTYRSDYFSENLLENLDLMN